MLWKWGERAFVAVLATGYVVQYQSLEPTPCNQSGLRSEMKNNSISIESKTLFELREDRQALITLFLENRVISGVKKIISYQATIDDKKADLARDIGKYSDGDREVLGKLEQRFVAIGEYKEYQLSINKTLDTLEKLMNWETIAEWSERDSFNWTELMHEHQICKDMSQCFCPVLMERKPCRELNKKLLNNQKEIEGAIMEMDHDVE